jgi:hypothetical protein
MLDFRGIQGQRYRILEFALPTLVSHQAIRVAFWQLAI